MSTNPSCRFFQSTRRIFTSLLLMSLLGVPVFAHEAKEKKIMVSDQQLLVCPNKPNCVSTIAVEESQAIAPFSYQKPLYEAKALLIHIFSEFPRTELVREAEAYLHFRVKSFFFGFVDDVEFRFDDTSKTVHFRSAARSGYYDFGVNRKRMEDLRGMLDAKL
ncbi:MAG: DUF1499 domain-containing protein [Nitrospirales bacterium]